MEQRASNALISSKPTDSGLSVSLHPLVLLTVSDQVTRHSVRQQEGPIAGALLGQQKGREITAEHAFPIELARVPDGTWKFDQDWLETRIQQYRDVHKAPALDFVGWFTLSPEDGPLPELVSLQKQATSHNDSAILLTLHPETVKAARSTNGRLPISIYESVLDVEQPKDDASMQVDGEEALDVKFRHLPYTIDTDETEMIALDYIAKGAGSAAAVDDRLVDDEPGKKLDSPVRDKKGKKRADAPLGAAEEQPTNGATELASALTSEEQDQIAGISTRLNSVKMLQTRISLLRSFVQSLPASYLSDQISAPLTPTSPDPAHLPHLRNLQALLTRLSLLTPVNGSAAAQSLAAASQAQSNDVALANLLSLLGQDIQSLSELGRKFATVDGNRNSKAKLSSGQKVDTASSGRGFFIDLDEAHRGIATSGTGGGMLV